MIGLSLVLVTRRSKSASHMSLMVQPAPLIMKDPSANLVQRSVNASGDAAAAVVVVEVRRGV